MWLNPLPSKVLLLGEYTVLNGGVAIAVPFGRFSGQWTLDHSLPRIRPTFINYLERINSTLTTPLSLQKLKTSEERGWRFKSNIPIGRGLGSSAALTASLYRSLTETHSISTAFHDMALIESFFHGRSSGLDALVSYTGKPIYFQKIQGPKEIELPGGKEQFYLIDSQIDRSTQPLVHWFSQQMMDAPFQHAMAELSHLTEICADLLRTGGSVLEPLNQISRLQYQFLNQLIPPSIESIWRCSLSNPQIAVKLCGAGGGGHFLVITSPTIDLASETELFKFPMFALDDLTAGKDESRRDI